VAGSEKVSARNSSQVKSRAPPGMNISISYYCLHFVGLDLNPPQLGGFDELEADLLCVSYKSKWTLDFIDKAANRRFC
jgi:hypothetical protein